MGGCGGGWWLGKQVWDGSRWMDGQVARWVTCLEKDRGEVLTDMGGGQLDVWL